MLHYNQPSNTKTVVTNQPQKSARSSWALFCIHNNFAETSVKGVLGMTKKEILEELRNYRKNHALQTIRIHDEVAKQHCTQVQAWLCLLPRDERLIVQKHVIDGLDWTRTASEVDKIWGYENGRSERTLKRKQASAINRIYDFMNQDLMGIDGI